MNNEINKALDILQSGGLILYPTDTVWGVGCDALNGDAIRRIYALKQRDETKSMIILLAEAKDIFRYVANPHPDIVHIVKGFGKPTTVIYDQAVGLPDNLVNLDGSIAIRVTRDPFCKALIKRLGHPLVSTSANISGAPSPATFNDINDQVKSGVDYIVAHRQDAAPAAPSMIVRVDREGALDVIRP